MSTKKKKTAAKRKPGAGAKATAEEQAKGVPENGYVVLFRLFTQSEKSTLDKLKDAVAAKHLKEGTRATWPAVIMAAMEAAA